MKLFAIAYKREDEWRMMMKPFFSYKSANREAQFIKNQTKIIAFEADE